MATIDHGGEQRAFPGAIYYKWEAMGDDDVGQSVSFPRMPYKTMCAQGTWGSATLVIEGSFDGGTTWHTLSDFNGNALSKTANAVDSIAENALLIRPQTSGGTSTDIDVYILATEVGGN